MMLHSKHLAVVSVFIKCKQTKLQDHSCSLFLNYIKVTIFYRYIFRSFGILNILLVLNFAVFMQTCFLPFMKDTIFKYERAPSRHR